MFLIFHSFFKSKQKIINKNIFFLKLIFLIPYILSILLTEFLEIED